ncbi:hypothetical protein F4V43_09940 [Paenibacillus spiritus]|uniref:Type II secretion system protein GspF domain-containing protein n=1 Tax=Paenibacillus spiritus TaxID=2496557 RepID=A0A5J5GAU4_9BACL|nr:hypothetical protein [Paenibacillus spiritus]KAA9004932.1 hypothetical protein F4V43_09940 [Paenibacillus spiritus]
MSRLLQLVAILGVLYLACMALIGAESGRERYLKRLGRRWEAVGERLKASSLQQLLDGAGLTVSARSVSLLRYGALLLYLGVQSLSCFLRKEPPAASDGLTVLMLLLVSSPARFMPMGWLLRWMNRRVLLQKDSELISFLRLYENNRLRRRGYVQFGQFCAESAGHFHYLRQDLYRLSEVAVDEGNEEAIEWFCSRFGSGHSLIGEVRSILLATEGMDDDLEAAAYLREQGHMIARMSSDQYLRRWSMIGDVASVINVIPSVAIFLMIVVLAMQYIMLIKGNFNGVDLFR